MSDDTLRKSEGPAVWYAPDMVRDHAWQHVLDDRHIAELNNALEQLGDARDIATVKRSDVTLPTLDVLLGTISDEVLHGRGFALLRGLPVERWTRRQSAQAYWIIGSRIGVAVPQNAQGHVLGHVRDLGLDPNAPMTRIYTTAARQEYHTDSCDIVALLCLCGARSGGASAIASSTTIWNEVLEQRPDLAKILTEPFHTDRKGEIPPGKQATYPMPVFHDHAGEITGVYARSFIEAAQTRPDTPGHTPLQIEALDRVDGLAESDAIRLDMEFRPGDMQLLHNHQILHARTSYEDWPEPERKRHLLRLWLSAHDGRELPHWFAERYGSIARGTVRGGIRVDGQSLTAPLEP
ncbi:MAG: TauD/TfdA family dioxygenase [Rhodospirillaceae bacterium]|nr:TauD/TfdA family dioxygenase [Rhodospirillaceae bacterium]